MAPLPVLAGRLAKPRAGRGRPLPNLGRGSFWCGLSSCWGFWVRSPGAHRIPRWRLNRDERLLCRRQSAKTSSHLQISSLSAGASCASRPGATNGKWLKPNSKLAKNSCAARKCNCDPGQGIFFRVGRPIGTGRSPEWDFEPCGRHSSARARLSGLCVFSCYQGLALPWLNYVAPTGTTSRRENQDGATGGTFWKRRLLTARCQRLAIRAAPRCHQFSPRPAMHTPPTCTSFPRPRLT